ncbi:potassium channel family protein [Anabaena sp. CA = ATCC 33047]|nr:potassium channel family protein [Anabaena sp. CA = ATCC 33047]
MVATIAIWLSLLLCGFALIYWTELGSGIQSSSGKTPTDFITAIYYSGYSLTTLGTGDLVPKTNSQRLLMILEAAIGFSIFTLSITYLLSVYSALIRRKTFALSLHYRTAGTADATEILIRLAVSPDTVQADVNQMASNLINLLESQHSYSAIIYFRSLQPYYALPRILFVLLDTATLIKSALNINKYCSLIDSTAVAELWGGGMQMLLELSRSFVSHRYSNINAELEQVWRQRYYCAIEKLRAEGIETRRDLEAGANLYICLRQQWYGYIAELADYTEFDWSEVAPLETRK